MLNLILSRALLYQVEQIPVVLGPVGTVLVFLYSLLTTGISIWFFWKSGEATSLRNTVKAQNDELAINNKTITRLSETNLSLERQNAELKTKTDLQEVIKVSNTLMQLAAESLELTRMNQTDRQKFERENAETHARLVESLNTVVTVGAERYQKAFEVIEQLAEDMREVRAEMARHFRDDRESGELLHDALRELAANVKALNKGGAQ